MIEFAFNIFRFLVQYFLLLFSSVSIFFDIYLEYFVRYIRNILLLKYKTVCVCLCVCAKLSLNINFVFEFMSNLPVHCQLAAWTPFVQQPVIAAIVAALQLLVPLLL